MEHMDDLATFLRQQYALEEMHARLRDPRRCPSPEEAAEVGIIVGRPKPLRAVGDDERERPTPPDVLREYRRLEGLRKILDLHEPVPDHGRFSEERVDEPCEPECACHDNPPVCSSCRDYAGDHDDAPCATVRLLALPYVDLPEYREEWRP